VAKTPPRTQRKLSVIARGQLGKPRTCTECDEAKDISLQTFALDKGDPSGWAKVCRVCQGVNSLSRGVRREQIVNQDLPLGDRRVVDRLINEMYLLHLTPQGDKDRLSAIISQMAQAIRDLAKDDPEASFRLFVECVKPLVAGWREPGAIHDDIIKGLVSQHDARLIVATRYSAKSTLTSIYVTWRLFLDPLLKIMVISRGEKLAKRMLRTVRRVFIENCPLLSHLVPTDDCLDSAEQFQVPQTLTVTTGGATLTSLGITSNLPGFRADLTICDDVEGWQEDTPEKVESLREALNEIHMINPRGEKIMLGTYQSEFSVYAHLADLEDEDGGKVWEEHRACMIEEDKIDGKVVYHSRWSAMFSDTDIRNWRSKVTERAWRLHVMLIADPDILNERPLRIRDLILMDWNPLSPQFPLKIEAGGGARTDVPTWSAPKGDGWYGPRMFASDAVPYVKTVMSVDPASGLAARDAIGVAILGITASGHGVIRHLEGVRGTDKLNNIRRVAQLAATFNCTRVLVEELADGLFGETLEGQLVHVNHPTVVEKVTTGGQQKGRRIIESLEPPMAAGRLVMLTSVASSDHGGDFVHQLVRITYDGRTGKAKDHDDIVDALAHAVAAEKWSLVSDIADNIGEHNATKVDRLGHLGPRYGGPGGDHPREPKVRRWNSDPGLHASQETLYDRLLAEDQVLAQMEARLEGLIESRKTDRAFGRSECPRVNGQIKTLTKQVKEVKEHQVL